jgi:2-methylisocitrate lyase-like PEP mutase family enzyme
MSEKTKRHMALFDVSEILIVPGVFDGYSVRLVEASGFKSAAISGAGVSESHLGWADRGVMSYKDNLEACRAITACTDLPLTPDMVTR